MFHPGELKMLYPSLFLPKGEVVVLLDAAGREQLIALLRDDTPVKDDCKKRAASLSLAMPIFTVSVAFGNQEYRYSIDPVFGLVDVCVGGRDLLYTSNLPLSEKFVDLYAQQTHDDSIKTVIAEARRGVYQPERKH